MITDVIDELLQIATAQGCSFEPDFKEKTIQSMTKSSDTNSIMYQDFAAKRPMEVETYLGSPIKLAQENGLRVPRIETLYALLHHCNIVNQQRPIAPSVSPNIPPDPTPPPRQGSVPPPRPPMNGQMNGPMNGNAMPGMRGGRTSSMGGQMRRGPSSVNGYPTRQSNGYNPRGPPPGQMNRRPSFEGNDLEEFSHLVLYDDIPEGGVAPGYEMNGGGAHPSELSLRERELNLRSRELQLREQEYNSMRGGRRRLPPSHRGGVFDEDEDDDDDFFDPMAARGPPQPQFDPDNVDMMSVTSRKTRKAPSLNQIRKDPEGQMNARNGMRSSQGMGMGRFRMSQNRVSAQMLSQMPNMNDSLLDNPMMGYSSNRYGVVDRKTMADESRSNSLTAARLNELQGAGMNGGMNGAYPSPMPRRPSQPPGIPFNPGGRPMGRPSPPSDGYMPSSGTHPNGGPSPPGMRQPVPRYPPGQGNAVAPQQVEQHAGVSNLYPSKGPIPKNVRSLTGSASASAASGDSQHLDSENSAHSSASSLTPRLPAADLRGNTIGVR